MYDLISGLIDHAWINTSSEQQYIYFICAALIIILTAVILDLIYRVISHFWR